MKALLRHFRGVWPTILLLTALLTLLGAVPALLVVALKGALDALQAGEPLGRSLGLLVALATFQAAGALLRTRVTRRLSWDLVHRLRSRVHERFLHLPVEGAVGDRLAALTHEADELQYGVSALITGIRAPVSAISLVVAAVYLAPSLTWRLGLLLPVLAALTVAGGRLVRWATQQWTARRSALLRELADQHSGLETTQDLGAQPLQQVRLEQLSRDEATARARLEWLRALPSSVIEWSVILTVALLLYWGQSAVSAGETTMGGLVAFAVAVGLLRRPLAQLSEVWSLAERSRQALTRIESVLVRRERPDATGTRGAFEISGLARDRIEAHCRIEPGEKVALVGASGSGKSSLLAVLAGRLAFEGHRDCSPAQLLRQDPWVFDRTLRENLLLGRPDACEADLRDQLVQVGFSDAVARLDEAAGERGRRLSGGERQRLCLARALLSEPSALLLDEVSSELDPHLAQLVASLLLALPSTVVFASHHPWFAAGADRVGWCEAGVLVDLAPHEVLLQRHAGYRRFWSRAA